MFTLLALVTVVVSQPCDGLFVGTLDQVYECAKTVSFNQASFQLQIDVLTSPPYHSTDFYVYRDVTAAGTGPPYDLTYDIDATLSAQRETVFPTDWDAEIFLWESFLNLQDMHTTYTMKPPFSYVFPMHPICLDLEYNDLSEKLEVKIASGLDADFLWANYYNGSANPFHGEVVSKINGVDAYTYLSSFAENDTYTSYSKDPSTRLNRMVNWDWHYRPYKKPKVGETITYELQNQETFTVPFYGCFNPGTGCVTVNNANDLINWLPSRRRQARFARVEKDLMKLKSELMGGIEDDATDEEKEEFSLKLDSLPFVDRLQVMEALTRRRELKAATSNGQQQKMERRAHAFTQRASSRLGDLRCFTDDDRPSVGIIQVMTFMPVDPDTPDTFLDVLDSCRSEFQRLGVSQVVFDLRSNGGGWIALAMHLARMFMKRPRPAGYDMFDAQVVTSVFDTAVRTQSHPWADLGDPALLESLALSVVLSDGEPDFTFSGGSAPYNSVTSFGPLLRLHPENILLPVMRDAMEFRLEPEDILIMTNGFCGSACGMFTKKMMRTQSAKTVFLGGIKDASPDPSSFDGAAVLGGLPVEGHIYGFSWGAIMPPTIESLWDKSKSDTTQLAEVVSVPPDWQDIDFGGPYNSLAFDLVVDPTRIWTHVLKYFDECADWNVQIASCTPGVALPNGIYGYGCNLGSYDNQTCVFKRCEEGYFFTGTACEPIIDAPMWMGLGLEYVFPPDPPAPGGVGSLGIVVAILLVLVFAML